MTAVASMLFASTAIGSPACDGSKALIGRVRELLCSKPIKDGYSDDDAQVLRFRPDGKVSIKTTREGKVVIDRELGYAIEDQMVDELDSRMSSVRLYFDSEHVIPQRDGSEKRIAASRSFDLTIEFPGFESPLTDADDYLVLRFNREYDNPEGMRFPVEVIGPRTSREATHALKSQVDSLMTCRHKCFLEGVISSDEYARFFKGSYRSVTTLTDADIDIQLVISGDGSAQVIVPESSSQEHRAAPQWLRGSGSRSLEVAGRLQDAQAKRRSDYTEDPDDFQEWIRKMAGNESAFHLGDRYVKATRTAGLAFLSDDGKYRIRVACYFDKQSNVRFVTYEVERLDSGRWVGDTRWAPYGGSGDRQLVELSAIPR